MLARPWKDRYVIGTWGSGSAKWKIPGPSPVQNEACVARPRRVIQLQANAYASTPDYAPPMHGMAIIDPPCTSCRRLFQNGALGEWNIRSPAVCPWCNQQARRMPQNSEWCAWPGWQGMDYALLQTERAKPVGFEVITQSDADMHVRRTRLVYRNYR